MIPEYVAVVFRRMLMPPDLGKVAASRNKILQPLNRMSIVVHDADKYRVPFAPDNPRSKRIVLDHG